MKQTKLDSLLETLTNIAIGAVIALITQIIWYPIIGKHFTFAENLMTTGFFTMVSIIRMYTIRRVFNGRSIYNVIRGRK